MPRLIKINHLAIKPDEVEAVEWSDVSKEKLEYSDEKLYQIVFHTKSGKKYTRRVYEQQLYNLIDKIKGEENELE
tara:strand:- start:4459 stop:4683 length:225 start_codon:yes stop_codon:yes gene_type:complete